MRYLLFIAICISCNLQPGYDKEGTEDYLTNGYICDKICQQTWGIEVYKCEDILTGKKVDVIKNPSNVFVIPEVK